VEISWKKFAHFFQHARSISRFLWAQSGCPMTTLSLNIAELTQWSRPLTTTDTYISMDRYIWAWLSKQASCSEAGSSDVDRLWIFVRSLWHAQKTERVKGTTFLLCFSTKNRVH
jgi:hypothetical protein